MVRPLPFAEWEPIYEAILADFGFDRAADERARECAIDIVTECQETSTNADRPDSDPAERFDLTSHVANATVRVVGAAPSLSTELDRIEVDSDEIVIAASTAADVLMTHGIEIDCMVTDLDKNVETARDCSHDGVLVVAHVHGDNIPVVREWLPQFDLSSTLVTTQAAPRGLVGNYGGFTDGDRAAFLADAFGAARLRFSGWSFDDPTVDAMKARKLRWAEHLLYWLETRRNERFGVLEGRREPLTTPITALSTE